MWEGGDEGRASEELCWEVGEMHGVWCFEVTTSTQSWQSRWNGKVSSYQMLYGMILEQLAPRTTAAAPEPFYTSSHAISANRVPVTVTAPCPAYSSLLGRRHAGTKPTHDTACRNKSAFFWLFQDISPGLLADPGRAGKHRGLGKGLAEFSVGCDGSG